MLPRRDQHKFLQQKNTKRRLSVYLSISNFVFKTAKDYYPQVFSEECKHIVKQKKFLDILLTIQKFLLIFIEKILMKKQFW